MTCRFEDVITGERIQSLAEVTVLTPSNFEYHGGSRRRWKLTMRYWHQRVSASVAQAGAQRPRRLAKPRAGQ